MATTEPPDDQGEIFRRLAAGYDQAIRRYQVVYDAMLELSTDLACVAAPGKSRCLDFGTGTGAALPLLLRSFDQVVAIEPGKPMIELARNRLSSAADAVGDRVSFIEGTVQSGWASALPEESFDAVHCSLVLMFVPSVPTFVRQGGQRFSTFGARDDVCAHEERVAPVSHHPSRRNRAKLSAYTALLCLVCHSPSGSWIGSRHGQAQSLPLHEPTSADAFLAVAPVVATPPAAAGVALIEDLAALLRLGTAGSRTGY